MVLQGSKFDYGQYEEVWALWDDDAKIELVSYTSEDEAKTERGRLLAIDSYRDIQIIASAK